MIEGDKRREGQKVVFERLVDLDINMNLMSDHNTIEAKNLYMSYSFIRSSLWQESLFVVGYLFVRLTGFRESLVLGKNLSVYFLELGNLIIVGDFNSHQLWVTLIIAEYQNGAMEVARNVVDSTLERPSLHEFPGLNNCQFILVFLILSLYISDLTRMLIFLLTSYCSRPRGIICYAVSPGRQTTSDSLTVKKHLLPWRNLKKTVESSVCIFSFYDYIYIQRERDPDEIVYVDRRKGDWWRNQFFSSLYMLC